MVRLYYNSMCLLRLLVKNKKELSQLKPKSPKALASLGWKGLLMNLFSGIKNWETINERI